MHKCKKNVCVPLLSICGDDYKNLKGDTKIFFFKQEALHVFSTTYVMYIYFAFLLKTLSNYIFTNKFYIFNW